MAPQSGPVDEPRQHGKPELPLTSGIVNYPAGRDKALKHPEVWIQGKREDDAVFPYWRVHDKLYDFTGFIKSHPGGEFWLETTQGTDITELFESSHFGTLPYTFLKEFFVKDISTPRTTPFTFEKNGFYQTLKRKVTPIVKKIGQGPSWKMLFIMDSLLIAFLVSTAFAALKGSIPLAIIGGVFLALMSTASHNFFHQKDNWRMYIFDLTFLSSRDWRISHVLSHHVFPNTIIDYEITMFEPIIEILPKSNKSTFRLYSCYCFLIAIYLFGFTMDYIVKNILVLKGELKNMPQDYIRILHLISMMYLSESYLQGLMLWYIVHMAGNAVFLFSGLQASHHHPDIYHEGDVSAKDKDWGVHQVVTTRERGELFVSSMLLGAITFGNHTLHHLFPTVDHSKLAYLQEPFLETCKEFGIKFEPFTPWKHIKGLYARITSTTLNPNPPNILSKQH